MSLKALVKIIQYVINSGFGYINNVDFVNIYSYHRRPLVLCSDEYNP